MLTTVYEAHDNTSNATDTVIATVQLMTFSSANNMVNNAWIFLILSGIISY